MELKNILRKEYITPMLLYIFINLGIQVLACALIVNTAGAENWLKTYSNFFNKYSLEFSFVGAVITLVIILQKFSKEAINAKNNVPLISYTFIIPFGVFVTLTLNKIIMAVTAYQLNATYTSVYNQPFWKQFIVMVVVLPITEELLFRGIIYGRMKKYCSITFSAFASSLLFALMHFTIPAQSMYALALGIFLVFVLETYNNIKAAILMHMVCNATTLIFSVANESFAYENNLLLIILLILSTIITGCVISTINKNRGMILIANNSYEQVKKEKEDLRKKEVYKHGKHNKRTSKNSKSRR